MSIIDRYIARHVLSAFTIVLLVVGGLDMLFALVEELKDIGGNYTFAAAVKYVMLTLPRRLYEFIPLATLIGCLLGLGILASNSELTVIRAAGISTLQIIFSVMKPVLFIIAIALGLGEFVISHTEQQAQSHRQLLLTNGGVIHGASKVWHRDEMTFLHINAATADGQVRGVTRYEFNDDLTLARSSFAKAGTYKDGKWVLTEIVETRFPDTEARKHMSTNRVDVSEIKSEAWETGLTPKLIKVVMVKPDNLSISGLIEYSAYLKEQGLAAERYQIAYWNKLLLPLAIFALVLIAVSFIFGPLRSVTLGQRLITGIVVGLVFKLSQDILGPTSVVFGFYPFVAAIIPILICLGVGFWLLNRAK